VTATTIETLTARVDRLEGQVKTVSHISALAQHKCQSSADFILYVQLDLNSLRSEVAQVRGRVTAVEALLHTHSDILNEHTATLNEHTATLNEHTATLNEHSEMLREILRRLPSAN
jgi:ABC-type transporter Mla subunit MlaD